MRGVAVDALTNVCRGLVASNALQGRPFCESFVFFGTALVGRNRSAVFGGGHDRVPDKEKKKKKKERKRRGEKKKDKPFFLVLMVFFLFDERERGERECDESCLNCSGTSQSYTNTLPWFRRCALPDTPIAGHHGSGAAHCRILPFPVLCEAGHINKTTIGSVVACPLLCRICTENLHGHGPAFYMNIFIAEVYRYIRSRSRKFHRPSRLSKFCLNAEVYGTPYA
jgi:hypothetical protein